MNIQKLREIPIEQVATQLGLKVQKHKTLCPFHNDKHPSLSFHVGRNTFKCFVCGAHGGTITLAMQVLGKNFKETCHWLANEHPHSCHPEEHSDEGSREHQVLNITHNSELITEKYEKYFIRPFLNQAARTFLFQERKLHPAVIRWCKLTSWTDRYGTPWLQIPYYDTDGTLIGIQNRRLTPIRHPGPARHPTPLSRGAGVCHEQSEESENERPARHPELVSGSVNVQPSTLNVPRFKFPKGSKCNIYNLPILNLLKEGENLWITEGCSDCWAMLSSGKKAIAIPSATLLNPKDMETLNPKLSTLNLRMIPDNDEPGERLYLQLKKIFPQLVRHPLPIGIKDFAEWYMSSRGA